MKGYITKGIGGFYYVKTPEGIVQAPRHFPQTEDHAGGGR